MLANSRKIRSGLSVLLRQRPIEPSTQCPDIRPVLGVTLVRILENP